MSTTEIEQDAQPSMAMIRVGNHDYPRVSSPQCTTCQSPQRQFIENEMLLGRTYAYIAREIAEMPTGRLSRPTARSMSNHVKEGHLPAPLALRRRILDERAEELGAAVDGKDQLVDLYVFNKMILAVGWEKFMDGKINLSASDIMAAMQFQHKLDTTTDTGFDVQVMNEALHIYMKIAMSFIPPDRQGEYGRALRTNPVLRALYGRVQAEEREEREAAEEEAGDFIDVEVLDDEDLRK